MSRPDLEEWDTHADLYDRNKGVSGDELSRGLDPIVLDLVGDVRDRVVIDAGCGNGYLAAAIAERGARTVVGMDGSQSLVDLGRQRFEGSSAQLIQHDLMEPWPVNAGSADVVLANMVLHYVPDVSVFADQAARSLAEAGAVVVSIDHPSHALVMRAARLAGSPNQKFLSDSPYLDTAQCAKRSLWGEAEITFYQRPLSAYTDAFFSHGFLLTDLVELGHEEAISDATDVIPRITVLRFVRADSALPASS